MKNVTFLGVEGSGKTVLTTALVNLFKEHEAEGWYLRPDSREAFRFLEQVPSALDHASLPHQTTSLKRLAWSIELNRETIRTFDVLDYPGEIYRLAFLDAKDDPDPHSFKDRVTANKEEINALLTHLMNSSQVFVLFNLADAVNLGQNAANLDAVWVTNACLDYLQKLPNHPTVTLLLTQIDRYAEFPESAPNAEVYVERHLPLIHRNFPNLDILAVSAIGPVGSTIGIDQIILRCLFECDEIQKNVRSLKRSSTAIYSWLSSSTVATLKTRARSIEREIEDCRRLTAGIPWFIPLGQLSVNGFCVDFDEMSDIASIVKILCQADLSLRPEDRINGIDAAIKLLKNFKPSSKTGDGLKNKHLPELEASFLECGKQISRRIVSRKRYRYAILILSIAAIAELAFIFLRAKL